MGQKVNPHLLRIKTIYDWDSRWFDEKHYKDTVIEDFKLRKSLQEKLSRAGVSKIEIERSINSIKVIVFVSRPGLVIGRGGSGLEELKKHINKFFLIHRNGKKQMPKIDIRIEPVKEPNLDAQLVAKNIVEQLLRRLPYKRVLNQNAERVIGAGALGIKILLAGRIGGAEISRREKIQKGTVPLSTIRGNIDYASIPALTKKGYIGVKVWINKKEEK